MPEKPKEMSRGVVEGMVDHSQQKINDMSVHQIYLQRSEMRFVTKGQLATREAEID